MARQNIGGIMDDGNLNKVNYNFIELYQMHQRMTAILNDLILESGGDSNLEVVQARGGKPVLNERFVDIETELADTIDNVAFLNSNMVKMPELDATNERIDHIVASAGDESKDTEIVDARTGINGNINATLKNRLDNEKHLNMLLSDNIDGTISEPIFNSDGTPRRIKHKYLNGFVVREDVFHTEGNEIKETRTLHNGLALIYIYDLSSLSTKVISLLPERHKNELEYTRNTYTEWELSGNAEVKSGNLVLYAPRDGFIRYETSLKPNKKYGLLYEIARNTLDGWTQMEAFLTGSSIVLTEDNKTGHVATVFETQNPISTNRFQVRISSNANNGEIRMKDFRIFELPIGTQIESDFETLEADQLGVKYIWN